MSGLRWALGVDVGGTQLSAGLVSEAGKPAVVHHRATPREQGAQAVMAALEDLAREVLDKAEGRAVTALGVGFGGPVDYAAQEVRRSHHVTGWEGVQVGERLGEAVGLQARLDNDANAGGLGEALFGAGRGRASILYVNVGTGVGGALIMDGRVYHGAHSNAGEIGHVVLDPGGPLCTCGKRGCVEAYCSGDALGRMARERNGVGAGPAGTAPEDLTGRRVGELAAAGDRAALEVVAESARRMGQALAAAANLADPDAVVLGGGVPEMGETYLAPVRDAFSAYATPVCARGTAVLAAELGYDAGVIGAAALALYG